MFYTFWRSVTIKKNGEWKWGRKTWTGNSYWDEGKAREECDRFNDNRTPRQIKRNYKMEYTSQR